MKIVDIFHSYTDRARKCFRIAEDLARERGVIEPEDLLHGIIREGNGVAVTVLKAMRIDLAGFDHMLEALEKHPAVERPPW